MFSGLCLCKPMRSTTAQDVAEASEEVVLRHIHERNLHSVPGDYREQVAGYSGVSSPDKWATGALRPDCGQDDPSVNGRPGTPSLRRVGREVDALAQNVFRCNQARDAVLPGPRLGCLNNGQSDARAGGGKR
ncbi:hypothetical protein PybrP1_006336 [[Pythium] brassicae (nom. inval.)]|nr:hypothetical protein PybrP1_006336 [[Pythium] brassicae (nom. inval.)]